MRNTLILLGVLLGLALAYFIFTYDKGGSSLDGSEIEFAITDTAEVSEIVMVKVRAGNDRGGIHLQKGLNGWKVSAKHYGFQPRIEKFLHVLTQIRVRDALAPKGQASAEALLEKGHTRIEIFSEEGLLKSYQIGTEYKGGIGTLMKLEGADDPYVVELPGLQGFLNVYYSLDEGYWRENLLFHGALSHLQGISVEYPDRPGSFSLRRDDPNTDWRITGSEISIDTTRLNAYLNEFSGKVYAETFAATKYPNKLDSLQTQQPTAILSLEHFQEEKERIYLFERSDNPNNYFGWVEGNNELLTIQHFVVDKFLKEKSHFLQPSL